jgi:hypothetical protein
MIYHFLTYRSYLTFQSFAVPRYIYDGYNVSGARGVYLNGNDQTDDDHMRYYITMETPKSYRIKTKATNRYVRLDAIGYVSSRLNRADARSLFKFEEMHTGKISTDKPLEDSLKIDSLEVLLVAWFNLY